MPVKVAMGRESLLWEGKPDERALHAREEGVLCMLRKIALREATTQAMACPLPVRLENADAAASCRMYFA